MKISFIFLVFLVIFLNSKNAMNEVSAQKTYVPDDNFEMALKALGCDDGIDLNDYVLTDKIKIMSYLNVSGKTINDLTGIGDFIGLKILYCESNRISNLNLTGATALEELYCKNNLMASLNVIPNINLIILDCSSNRLTDLDVSHNTKLTGINCRYNLLTLLNVTQNTNLIGLNCSGNLLTNLDLRQNTKITSVTCNDNKLVQIQTDGAADLSSITCNNNQIVYLDLRNNIALTQLLCNNNNLISLNIHNGHNDLLSFYNSFDATGNPGLTCIEVDNAVKANNGEAPYTSWKKPSEASYSENCSLQTTYVPDVNFELALQERGYDGGTPDHYVFTHEISVVYDLDVSGENINDLTGIGDFRNLGHLNCSNNIIVSLDLSRNESLTLVECNNNQLTSLNVRNGHNTLITTFNATGNPALTCIEVDDEMKANGGLAPYTDWQKDPTAGYCANCSLFGVKTWVPDDWFEGALILKGLDQGVKDDYVNASIISRVTSLDVTSKYIRDLTGIEGFTALEILKCADNFLDSLDLSQNSALVTLTCYHNQLKTLDLSHNSALVYLDCANNEIESLDVSHNPFLASLDCQINQISILDLSNNPGMTGLSCRANLLQSLDVSQNLSLKTLDCGDNQFTGLDLSKNTSLTHLDCSGNQLTQLDVGGGAMVQLKCSNNNLTELVVSNNTNLARLECRYNQLTNLDVGSNPKIWLLDCSHNQLQDLDIGNIAALVDFVCTDNQLTGLVVSGNTLLGGLYCGNNQIESLILNNNTALLTLDCYNNQITSLDLSDNLKLKYIRIYDNPLEELIMPGESDSKAGEIFHSEKSEFEATAVNTTLKGLNISRTSLKSINVLNFASLDSLYVQGSKLDSLDVSGNIILRILNTTGTPLKCIQVNQNQLNTIPAGWIKDAATIYSTDCKSATFIYDPLLSGSIRLYPNPADDVLMLESEIRLIRVGIYSITGLKIRDVFSDFNALRINDLSEGIYMLVIETEYGCTTKKFSKK